MRVLVLVGLFTLAMLMRPAPAAAALTTFSSFVGNVGLSTDGLGTQASSGTISASVPAGSTVLAAYLYSSFSFNYFGASSVTLQGTPITYTPLGATALDLQAGRADVTSIVAPIINGGPGGVYNFMVTEANSANTEGEALVVVYSHPALATGSVGILDGFSRGGGDVTTLNFGTPVGAGFSAEMRLGIGFSCCDYEQRSTVTVNGNTLTTVAGNADDGQPLGVGSMITVGGFDDPFSPLNTIPGMAAYDADRERYDLSAFIAVGSTAATIGTNNVGEDDNIFLAAFAVSGPTGFNAPAPAAVPEPAALALFGLGLLAGRRRLRRSR